MRLLGVRADRSRSRGRTCGNGHFGNAERSDWNDGPADEHAGYKHADARSEFSDAWSNDKHAGTSNNQHNAGRNNRTRNHSAWKFAGSDTEHAINHSRYHVAERGS